MSTWLVSPALAPGPKLHRELRREVTALLCSVCLAEEESQMVYSFWGTEQWTLACWEKIQAHQFNSMNGECIDLIQELELTMPYPRLLIYSFAFLVT